MFKPQGKKENHKDFLLTESWKNTLIYLRIYTEISSKWSNILPLEVPKARFFRKAHSGWTYPGTSPCTHLILISNS